MRGKGAKRMQTIRERTEELEYQILSPDAAKSREAKRRGEIDLCPFRTAYQRDRDRILHCKAFRRLKHKTQVFLAPEGDHYRTRLTHTLEVSQIARTIAKSLRLNEDLTEAIALGHDLGHTPFGHAGERVLNRICPEGFRHSVQSVRTVEFLEKNGRGLNLTKEVRDGILNHTGPVKPMTLEGQIVKISDRVAYINHDIDDALRGGVLKFEDLPEDCLAVLGQTHSARINTLVTDLMEYSEGKQEIGMSPEKWEAMNKLRSFMFKNVYQAPLRRSEMEQIDRIITQLYEYFLENPEEMSREMQDLIPEWGIREAVKDAIASMTDRQAIRTYEGIFMPHFGDY